MPPNQTEQWLLSMADEIASLRNRIENIETIDNLTIKIKDTAGTPATGNDGIGVLNTTDNTFHIYANGGWRLLASW